MDEETKQLTEEMAGEKRKPGPIATFWAVISYLGVLALIPLVLKLKNSFVLHHLKQGLLLFGVEVLLVVIGVIPLVGWVIVILGWLLCTILSLLGIFNAIIGRYWYLPWLSKYSQKIRI